MALIPMFCGLEDIFAGIVYNLGEEEGSTLSAYSICAGDERTLCDLF